MKPSLASFQDAFVDALYGSESSLMDSLTTQPGFTVYRNTVLKGSTDALLANFPTVERLVGTDWLRSAVAIYARLSPPTDARLLHYGTDFPRFLDEFEPAREMPYLGGVARLDLLWTNVHCAIDEPGLELSDLSQFTETELGNLWLAPRAAAGWLWLPDCPAYTIWRVNREQLEMPEELEWQSEGALLTRKASRVHWQPASAADCAFLNACTAHLPLDLAADKAIEAEPDLNLENLIIRLVSADAFVSMDLGLSS